MKKILKASAIVGSGSLVSIGTGIIRNKIFALILGPYGIGLYGLMQSVMSVVSNICGIGLSSSGVRQIALAKSESDDVLMSRSRDIMRGASAVLGLIGALFLYAFRYKLSVIVFGNQDYAHDVAILGVGVWAVTVSGSQTAIVNGLRKISDLTRITIIKAVVSMMVSIAAIWMWRFDGIAFSVMMVPCIGLLSSWWYSRKIVMIRVDISFQASVGILRSLFRMGVVFMLSSAMMIGTQLLVRIIITRKLGIDATGQFQAAWSISMTYLGFVLGAMGTDYYPRLTAITNDQAAINKIVNEQTEVALLLAGPVVLVMLTLTSQAITVLYSGKFVEAISVLRWQVLGDLFKVISWTIGFILLAKGQGRLFLVSELSWNVVYLSFIWIGLSKYGVVAAGMAFLIAYIMYFLIVWLVVSLTNAFKWTTRNYVYIIALLLSSSVIMSCTYYASKYVALAVGIFITIIVSSFSLAKMAKEIR